MEIHMSFFILFQIFIICLIIFYFIIEKIKYIIFSIRLDKHSKKVKENNDKYWISIVGQETFNKWKEKEKLEISKRGVDK